MEEYLYHYTNLNSLISILRSRKIRFSSLLFMDDNEESLTADLGSVGKYCYVSSWTDMEEEKIELWGLYTNNMTGVRIRLKKIPFTKSVIQNSWYCNGSPYETYLPEELYNNKNYYCYPTLDFLRKVKYTQDNKLLEATYSKKLEVDDDGKFNMIANFNNIGLYKRDCWKFQQEYRYSMFLIPHAADGSVIIDSTNTTDGLPFMYYDMPISEEGIKSIEITTGPRMSDNDKFIIKSVIQGLGYDFEIKESELKIK